MKRLIRKAEKEVYLPLDELDEADVKFNRCPLCKSQSPLERDDGFKHCPKCRTKFKLFDGNAYLIK